MCDKNTPFEKAAGNKAGVDIMELVIKGITDYQTSKAITLPFINLPPSRWDAIYSVLAFAVHECTRYGQQTCLVTFHQPLYEKVVNTVAYSSLGLVVSICFYSWEMWAT